MFDGMRDCDLFFMILTIFSFPKYTKNILPLFNTPFALLAVGVIAISFAAPLFKLTQPTHPLVAAATRLTFASILWLLISLRSPSDDKLSKQSSTAILCGFCYALHFGAWVWSLGLTSTLASATLVTTTPIMLAIIALITGKDRPNKKLLLSGLIACIGVAIFAFDHQDQEGYLSGDLLALIGALAMVPYLLLTRRLGSDLQIASFSMITTLVGATVLWITAWFSLPSVLLQFPTGQALWALIALTLIPQMVGHSALTLSLKHFTPTEVGLATLLEPLGASFLAWWWLDEHYNMWGGVASFLTLCGVYLAFKHKD